MSNFTPGSPGYVSPWRDEETHALGKLAESFFQRELVPHREKWESQHHVDRAVWEKAGELGLLCCSIPTEYGGGGGTYAHDIAVIEAQARTGEMSFGNFVHSGIVAHYLLAYGTQEQQQAWLPKMASGEVIASVAMTEPGAGSDLQSIRTTALKDGDEYVINGAKTFITNGRLTDLVVLAAKTDPTARGRGVSLLLVESTRLGFSRGRDLEKIGQHGADTTELFFDDVRVPVGNLLGAVEGQGFRQLMSQLGQERLAIAVIAVSTMEAAIRHTIDHVKARELFGRSLFEFQNTKFVLAEAATVAHISRTFLDSCITRHLEGTLDAAGAAMAKWWLTEQQCLVIDSCLQLFGGYGYMREYPVARMFADARVQRIYGGANELMKELVARAL
ncbi:acyl-CoA dehydrogenase family protein [Streptomyces sp. NPDC051976]|uniref:acyl-CoA dehydrogenase family protein n=1 Tax=Streptomyces sp. NPDC051976 TaxID=3154947 RepID=UPI0034452C94